MRQFRSEEAQQISGLRQPGRQRIHGAEVRNDENEQQRKEPKTQEGTRKNRFDPGETD